MKMTIERMRLRQKKTLGVPRLPLAVDAAYDNKWGGNLIAYAYDPNPARFDPVYTRLKEGFRGISSLANRDDPGGHVAEHYMNRIIARQINETTYNHLLRMPLHLLKKEFAIAYRTDSKLRQKIDVDYEYMYDRDRREWTDC